MCISLIITVILKKILTKPKPGLFLCRQLKLGKVISIPFPSGSFPVQPWWVCPLNTSLGLICFNNLFVAFFPKQSHCSLNGCVFSGKGAESGSSQSSSDGRYNGKCFKIKIPILRNWLYFYTLCVTCNKIGLV